MLLKKNLFSLLFFVLIFAWSVSISGCEKENNIFNKQSTVDQIVSQPLFGIWPSSVFFTGDEEISNIFRHLPEDKFDEFFKKSATIYVDRTYESWPKEIKNSYAKEEIINFYTKVYKNMNILSIQKYNQTFNKLTKDEALEIIDNDYDDIVDPLIDKSTSQTVKHYFNYFFAPSSGTIFSG